MDILGRRFIGPKAVGWRRKQALLAEQIWLGTYWDTASGAATSLGGIF